MSRGRLSWIACLSVAACLPSLALAALGENHQRLQSLVDRPRVSRAECVQAVGVLVWGRRAPADPATAAVSLRRERFLMEEDLQQLDLPATRGYACRIFMRVLGWRGGILSRLFGPGERLAYQYFKSLRMIPEGGDSVAISGPELSALLALSRARAPAGALARRRR